MTPKQRKELAEGRKAIRRMQYWDGVFAQIDSLGPRFEFDAGTDPKTGITTHIPKLVKFIPA